MSYLKVLTKNLMPESMLIVPDEKKHVLNGTISQPGFVLLLIYLKGPKQGDHTIRLLNFFMVEWSNHSKLNCEKLDC